MIVATSAPTTNPQKQDVEATAYALASEVAAQVLQQALQHEHVLPSNVGNLGQRGKDLRRMTLAEKIAAEPGESFDAARVKSAMERALDMLETEHRRRGRHATILLALFGLGILVTLALIVAGFTRQDQASYVNALVSAVPSGVLGLWYRYTSRIVQGIMKDVQTLARATDRRKG